MKLGPLRIHLYKENVAGLEIYPWQALTTDRLSPEVRALVAKMARAEVRSALDAFAEETLVGWSHRLHREADSAIHALRDRVGTILPGAPAEPPQMEEGAKCGPDCPECQKEEKGEQA